MLSLRWCSFKKKFFPLPEILTHWIFLFGTFLQKGAGEKSVWSQPSWAVTIPWGTRGLSSKTKLPHFVQHPSPLWFLLSPPTLPLQWSRSPWLLSCSSRTCRWPCTRLGSVIVTATFQPQQGSDRGGWLDTTFPALAGGSLSLDGRRLSNNQVKWEYLSWTSI